MHEHTKEYKALVPKRPQYSDYLLKQVHSKYIGGVKTVTGMSLYRTSVKIISNIALMFLLLVFVLQKSGNSDFPFLVFGIINLVGGLLTFVDIGFCIWKKQVDWTAAVFNLLDIVFWVRNIRYLTLGSMGLWVQE